MDSEHKLFAIYLLKRLAMSDKTFQISEQAYVDQAARHLGLDRETIDSISLDSFEVKSMPSREQDRMTILYYLLFLAEADGVLLSEEKLEVRKIGFELGFRDNQIIKMIAVVEDNKNQRFNPQQLIDIIRAVLN